MDKLEGDHIPGLLMLGGFEKAFDTVEWPFIKKIFLNFKYVVKYQMSSMYQNRRKRSCFQVVCRL
jgi:hypothetical protein